MATKAKFRIFRFDPEKDREFRFQDFDVPYEPGMTVLNALYHVVDHLDPSLCFRVSCRAGICGSCAMHIDGRYRLACETQASLGLEQRVTVRPLAHLPIIRDLVVDMEPFWAHYKRIVPFLLPGGPDPAGERPQTPAERENLDILVDCILCASCHASCPMTASDESYLGPAALTKANRFCVDSRDAALDQRLRIVADEHGIWRCHTVFNCSLACPKEIDPAGSIANLKRLAMRRYITKTGTR